MAVLPLLLGCHLAERFTRSRHKKNRVVAEARLPSPPRHHLASAFAFEELGLASRRRQRDHAHEPCVPRPRHALEASQELGRPFLLCRAEPSRADAGKATQRFDLEPRVVTQRRQAGPLPRRLRLQTLVVAVRVPHLVLLGVEAYHTHPPLLHQIPVHPPPPPL